MAVFMVLICCFSSITCALPSLQSKSLTLIWGADVLGVPCVAVLPFYIIPLAPICASSGTSISRAVAI
ncbi:hypothetical protein OE88DRAFT_1668134 [Heliocybe sulcata]|uniref:Secreted peptide n=1 Tax=Heliocybe sulcata TaxID=5364 RepID=A0A5C3MNA4_9AGAM|nr:hypothetical protein OE88DRAFT_1668134 [Heliocybe sulcata]